MSVTAKRMKKPWTIAVRLGRFIFPRPGKNHYLPVRWNVHAEPALSRRAKVLPARCVANFRVQSRPIAFQRRTLAVERRQTLRLRDPDGPSPDDGEGDQDERREDDADQRAAAKP